MKWPIRNKKETIWIIHDNAKPHVSPTDPDVVQAGRNDGWDIRLRFQPPNSPDFNVLDLGFFAAIQSLQYRKEINSIDELIQAVYTAFNELSRASLNNIFLTLQKVMEQALLHGGSNDFKIPHSGKQSMIRGDCLPETFKCTGEAFLCGTEELYGHIALVL
jgi:hypothetical protein